MRREMKEERYLNGDEDGGQEGLGRQGGWLKVVRNHFSSKLCEEGKEKSERKMKQFE